MRVGGGSRGKVNKQTLVIEQSIGQSPKHAWHRERGACACEGVANG